MKNAKRMLALAGMTLAAGAMLGIAPAQAAPATDQSPRPAAVVDGWGPGWNVGWNDDYVVGVYLNPWQCRNAGLWVDRVGAWSDFDCVPAWDARWGRIWVLQIERDYWSWNRWNGWQGNWPYRPNYLYGNAYNIGAGYVNPFYNRAGFRYGHGVNGLGWGSGLNGFRYGAVGGAVVDGPFGGDAVVGGAVVGGPYGGGAVVGGAVVDGDPWYKAGKVDKSVKSHKIDKSYKYDKKNKVRDVHKSPLGALNLKDQHKIK
ncbi:hypothetical protein Aca07nite_70380 [Actinoplanes capillaceus]|uniref:YXWGXW repeat-containing protein n=1 Tax=Actinoplanes campanulatus TaxID=113559 RepID=A0ABQ3WU92_9ACTN|nr:hypothetical protein [Actinoplanes capillaceus]GID49763.1 hypothetical protein Aca07nite_70380 [Actinoplanes capillaceus]